jgi:glyoxylase-like metal-dependent hydrolase (beta-lactamase superfamily II)
MQEVQPGIFYTTNFSGPTLGAVILPRGILFIDAPLRPEDGNTWKAALLNRSSGIIHKLLVTLDAHPDRTIGANAMNCSIVAHREAAQTIEERSTVFRGQLPESGSEWERFPETSGLRWSPPDIMYTQNIQFHWGDPSVVLEYHPGPRPGTSWVIIPEQKTTFVGDTVMDNCPPFLAQADIPQWVEALEHLRSDPFDGYTIISGRGGPVPQQEIKKQQRTLEKMLKRIERLGEKNAPPEAIADLAEVFLNDFSSDTKKTERYLQRLRYGLRHYYLKNYPS